MNSGFTLIELLIAIFVITVGITGAFVAIQQGISAIDYANARFTAALLAQEGVEIVKNIRDTNLLEYAVWDGEFSPGPNLGDSEDFEVEYIDARSESPILKTCVFPCDFENTNLRFLKKEDDSFYNYALGNPTKFKRKVHIERVDSNHLKLDITVYWRKRGGEHYELVLRQHIYNWLNI